MNFTTYKKLLSEQKSANSRSEVTKLGKSLYQLVIDENFCIHCPDCGADCPIVDHLEDWSETEGGITYQLHSAWFECPNGHDSYNCDHAIYTWEEISQSQPDIILIFD